jgi:hypothetical protein
MRSVAISCVIDDQPKFHAQVCRWLRSLKSAEPPQGTTVMVHHVGSLPRGLADWLSDNGAHVREVERFAQGPGAYCNKLQQFEHVLRANASHVILSDADLFFLEDPTALIQPGLVSARIVDAPNPAPDVLRALLDAAGYGNEPLSGKPGFALESTTHPLNCNGGLYVMERRHLQVLAPVWRRWAGFCLSREDVLGSKVIHADQLGFMLSMLECGLPFEQLPVHANFPTHFPASRYGEVPASISSLHYHGNIVESGRLGAVGIPGIDLAIETANRRLPDQPGGAEPSTGHRMSGIAC